jgi:hypothetical protein
MLTFVNSHIGYLEIKGKIGLDWKRRAFGLSFND